ncbi:MAG TPA: response regulator [Patescibacteria group bacterium]|nr:response regulator [Patescibacteria group bacterium]
MSRILIVEDDAWQREHVASLLTKHGYTVKESPHALDAINSIDTFGPDAIVLDLMLPGANGLVLLHELQSHSDLASIPIVVMSTRSDVDAKSLVVYGVKVVLDKATMQPSDLLSALRKVL